MSKQKQALVLLSNPMTFDMRPQKTARSLQKNGFKVNVFCWDREDNNPKTEQRTTNFTISRFGLKSTYSQKNSKLLGFLLYYIWCILKSFTIKPDIIYCNDVDTLPLGVVIKILKRSGKVIYDMHDHPQILIQNLPLSQKIESFIFQFARRYADHIIVVNDAFITYLESVGFDSKKITCILNVSEVNENNIPKPPPNKGLTLFYYGPITKVRGIDKLCKIVADLPNVNLNIAGRGDMEIYVENSAHTHGNIRYIGWIDQKEIDRLTKEETSVIVVLSDMYNVKSQLNHILASPNKLFTGMANGIPVLVTAGEYMSSVVKKYQCGRVIDFTDFESSRSQIVELRDNPNLRLKMGVNGYIAAKNNFNWEKMEHRLSELWSQLTS